MLNCDGKMRHSRLTRRPQSASRIWTCSHVKLVDDSQAVLSSEYGMRNDGLLSVMEDRKATLSHQKKEPLQNLDPKTMHVPVVAVTGHQATPAKADRYSEWSKTCMEGFIEDAPPTESAGGDSAQGKQPEAVALAGTPIESKPTSRHNVLLNILQGPKCKTCNMTSTTRFQNLREMRRDCTALPRNNWRSAHHGSGNSEGGQSIKIATRVCRGGAKFLFVLVPELSNQQHERR